MTCISVTVDVDVELDDIDDDDLVAELESRGLATPSLSSGGEHALHEIYYALKFDLNDKALGLMRAYCADQLGVVL